MSILNWQVNCCSNFASFFIVITHNSPVSFKLIHFLLWIKGYHQSPNFETFQCFGENLPNSPCHFWKHKSVFFSNFASIVSVMKDNSSVFSSSEIIYFGQKQPIKVQIFGTFDCLGQNSSNSSCQFWNGKSIPPQTFHHSSLSLHITPLQIFSSCIFYFGQKDLMKVPIFKCFVENLSNPSCHFPNHKSVFLKILNESLVSWKKTHLYFSRSTLYTFHEREQSKCKFWYF